MVHNLWVGTPTKGQEMRNGTANKAKLHSPTQNKLGFFCLEYYLILFSETNDSDGLICKNSLSSLLTELPKIQRHATCAKWLKVDRALCQVFKAKGVSRHCYRAPMS